jgi:hypothetical protein
VALDLTPTRGYCPTGYIIACGLFCGSEIPIKLLKMAGKKSGKALLKEEGFKSFPLQYFLKLTPSFPRAGAD